jgi:hypothetical protein
MRTTTTTTVLVALVMSALSMSGHTPSDDRAVLQGAQATALIVDRWPLPKLPVNGAFDGEAITYLGQDSLLVADALEQSIWAVDPDTGDLQPWLVAPAFGMWPFELRYEPRDDVVFAASYAGSPMGTRGSLAPEYLVLGRDSSLISRWRLRDDEDIWRSSSAGKLFAVSPLGLLAWIVTSPPGSGTSQYSRIAAASRSGLRAPGGRCSAVYNTIAVDAADRYYLKLDRPDGILGYRIDRTDSNCHQPAEFLHYSGQQPYWGNDRVALASWPSPDQILIANDHTITAVDDRAMPLFTAFVPQLCYNCPIYSLAARGDNAFAALARSSPGTSSADREVNRLAQVVHFDDQGIPIVRSVFRSTDMPEMWRAARIAAGPDDKISVLYPDLDEVATFNQKGDLERTRAVVSWASDLDTSGRLLAVKGSSGERGAVAVYDGEHEPRHFWRCECDESAGIALADGRVFVGNTLTARLSAFDYLNGHEVTLLESDRTGDLVPLDVSANGRETYFLNGATGTIEVFDTDGNNDRRRSIAAPKKSFRVDSRTDGSLAVLGEGGQISIIRSDASHVETIDIHSLAGADKIAAVDISWTASGDLYVLDATRPSIVRLRLSNDVTPAPAAPTPDVVAGPGLCKASGDKQAWPGRVVVGDEVNVRLRLAIDCPPAERPELDVLVVMSGDFMSGSTAVEARDYHAAMLQAAERLAGSLDLGRDRIAVYQMWYGRLSDFSTDMTEIRSAIRRVGPYQQPFRPADAEQFSGLGWALQYLRDRSRPGADRVLVQFSWPFGMYAFNEADLAERARQADVRTILIYRPWEGRLPSEYRDHLLAMVAVPDDLLNLEDVLAHDALISRLSEPYQRRAVRDVEVWDTVGPDMRLVVGSSVPLAQESADTTVWRSAGVPATGLSMTIRVKPLRTGRLPTNLEAVAFYTDSEGALRKFVFPVPMIAVIAPTSSPQPTPTPTLTPTGTATVPPTVTLTATPPPIPTSAPVPAYLPLVLWEKCVPGMQRIDVALLIDTSSSMADLTSGGRPKIDAARAAATTFVDQLNLGAGDQASIVWFSDQAAVEQQLTSSRMLLASALGGLSLHRSTRIDLGIGAAREELTGVRHRDVNTPVMIVLTDGRANPVPAEVAVEQARLAKESGIVVFSIGIGNDLDDDALRAIASRPEYFYRAPDAELLAEIYHAIAVTIPCPPAEFWGAR